jgi:uncharacterized protein YuzE
MKLTVNYEADALYLQLTMSRIVGSGEVAPGVVLDYNENDQVVGVEVLGIQHSRQTARNCSKPLPT